MAQHIDQAGFVVYIPQQPKRIISIVPSQTELLADLGLDEHVVGITKFCVHPSSWKSSKKIVGGTKKLNMEVIAQLEPDLIIANKEENEKAQIETLRKNYPVWISDIHDLDDALGMIRSVGEITGTSEKALNICSSITEKFNTLATPHPVSAAYLIWQKPFMTVGHDTFIHDMMKRAGFRNVFEDKPRYPETTLQELRERKPEIILLSSEPFPFREKHAAEMSTLLPEANCMVVDGEMFSWYGSRLLLAVDYLRKMQEELGIGLG